MNWEDLEAKLRRAFFERPLTLKTYLSTWGLFRRSLGGRGATPELAAEWLDGLECKEATKKRHRAALKWLLEKGMGDSATRLPHYRPITPRPSVLTPEQVEGLKATLETPLERALVMALYGGALRIAEALSLKAEDIDWGGFLTIRRKGGEHQGIPVGKGVTDALREHLGGRERGLVFHLSYHEARAVLKAVARRMGLKDIRPHQLRHTAATQYARRGADLYTLQLLLGHANPGTTEIYIHLTAQELKERLPDLL